MADVLTKYATTWLITRKDGTVFAFTDHDQDLTIGATTYKSALSYSASAIRTQSDLAVDNLEAIGVLDSTTITDADLRAGLFNSARIVISAVDWSALSVVKILRAGWVGQVKLAKNSYTAELRGLMQALQTPLGIVSSPRCRVDLGSSQCGVNLGAVALTDVAIDGVAKTFTTAAGSFTGTSLVPGFAVGQSIVVSGRGEPGNNATFVITAIASKVITCAGASGLVSESAGDISITLTQTGAVASVASQRQVGASGLVGGIVRNVSYTADTISFLSASSLVGGRPVIQDTAFGFIAAGFLIGDQVQVSGTSYNNTVFVIGNIRTWDFVQQLVVAGNVANENAGNPVTIATFMADYFAFGLLTWTSGFNTGLTMEVKSWDGTNLTLFLPMPNPIQPGDTFTITPGCDENWPTCSTKFDNPLNFRAEPFMAGQDAALYYPDAG